MEYLGSKRNLLEWIEEVTDKNIKKYSTVADLYAGTGAVGKMFFNKGKKIISNDVQYYSYVQNYVQLKLSEFPKFEKFGGYENALKYLDGLKKKKGFIWKNYSPSGKNEFNRMFFTEENAAKIDSIRSEIQKLYENNEITKDEYYVLLYTLLNSLDRFSNTAVVYEAYLKTFKGSALKPFELKPIDLEEVNIDAKKQNTVFCEDANMLIDNIEGDLLYLDPPYNSRQYSTNYHLLETVIRYDDPVIKNKAGIRADSFRSTLSKKADAFFELSQIIKQAKFKYVLMSYSDEGIIDIDKFIKELKKDYKVTVNKSEYRRFKSNSKSEQRKNVIEYLILVEK